MTPQPVFYNSWSQVINSHRLKSGKISKDIKVPGIQVQEQLSTEMREAKKHSNI